MRFFFIYNIIFISFVGLAQENLVPNGSFNKYDSLPDGVLNNSIKVERYLSSWVRPTDGTPDYFHRNSRNPKNSVPFQEFGFNRRYCQNNLNSTGGFCGFVFAYSIFDKQFQNEYIQAKLSSNPKTNRKYSLSFKIASSSCTNLALSSVGVHLNPDSIRQFYPNSYEYPNWSNFEQRYTAQYYVSMEKYASTDWIGNEYIFRAKGTERWLTIGNFWNDGQYDSLYDSSSDTTLFSYYFIDDVSLVEIPCLVGQDIACIDEKVTYYSTFAGPFEWWHNDEMVSSDSIYRFSSDEGWYFLKTPNGEDSIYLTVLDEIGGVVDISDTLCPYDSLEVNLPPGYDYLWEDGSADSVRIFSTPMNQQVIVLSKYCVDTITILLDYYLVPAGTDRIEYIFCRDSISRIEVNLDADSIKWNDDEQGSIRTFYQAGHYGYEIADINGCLSIGTVVITEQCLSKYFIPNAFVPEGFNKTFKPFLKDISEATLTIFNRWGEKLYEQKAPEPEWNGYYEDNPCPVGVYFYTITFLSNKSNESKNLKGILHLMR